MITRNEILHRHNLLRDNVAILSRDELIGWEKVNPKLAQCTHALCSQNYVDHWDCWGAKFDIVAYYPEPGVYLVKRKTPKPQTVTARMDYQFGFDKDGYLIGEYGTFRLTCEEH